MGKEIKSVDVDYIYKAGDCMNSVIEDILISMLKEEESYYPNLYKCSKGVDTIGYGTARPLTKEEKEKLGVKSILELKDLSEEDALYLLKNEVYSLYSKFSKKDWFNNSPRFCKIIVLDLAYNVGFSGCLKFKNMIKAIKNEDYESAMIEILDSDYFKDVKGRALRLAMMFVTKENYISIDNARKLYKVLQKRI